MTLTRFYVPNNIPRAPDKISASTASRLPSPSVVVSTPTFPALFCTPRLARTRHMVRRRLYTVLLYGYHIIIIFIIVVVVVVVIVSAAKADANVR